MNRIVSWETLVHQAVEGSAHDGLIFQGELVLDDRMNSCMHVAGVFRQRTSSIPMILLDEIDPFIFTDSEPIIRHRSDFWIMTVHRDVSGDS